ncbi:MAG TPA: CocE/NonD family hydrolase, partial [Actinopolymorphaceae bacterium]
HVTFASSSPVADVTVKLVDVHPDGRAMLVVDSVRRLTDLPADGTEVTVDVGSTALVFGAGHRIRVEIASSNFPRFAPVPGRAEQTVWCGGRARSRVELPVVELPSPR